MQPRTRNMACLTKVRVIPRDSTWITAVVVVAVACRADVKLNDSGTSLDFLSHGGATTPTRAMASMMACLDTRRRGVSRSNPAHEKFGVNGTKPTPL